MIIRSRESFSGIWASVVLVWSIGNGMDTWGTAWTSGDASTRDDFHASNGVRGHFC